MRPVRRLVFDGMGLECELGDDLMGKAGLGDMVLVVERLPESDMAWVEVRDGGESDVLFAGSLDMETLSEHRIVSAVEDGLGQA